ncbi:MAG: hypothetical protein ACJ795_12910, partial [Ktedonobacteraceae bacterium]
GEIRMPALRWSDLDPLTMWVIHTVGVVGVVAHCTTTLDQTSRPENRLGWHYPPLSIPIVAFWRVMDRYIFDKHGIENLQ